MGTWESMTSGEMTMMTMKKTRKEEAEHRPPRQAIANQKILHQAAAVGAYKNMPHPEDRDQGRGIETGAGTDQGHLAQDLDLEVVDAGVEEVVHTPLEVRVPDQGLGVRGQVHGRGETRVVGGDVVAEAAVEEGIATIDRVRSLEGRAEAEGPHTPAEAPGLTQGRGQEIGVDQGIDLNAFYEDLRLDNAEIMDGN